MMNMRKMQQKNIENKKKINNDKKRLHHKNSEVVRLSKDTNKLKKATN